MKNKKMSTIIGEFVGLILVCIIVMAFVLAGLIALGGLSRVAHLLWFGN